MSKIKKGQKFKCIEDVVMNNSGDITYIKGNTYTSESDGCITNEDDDIYHGWSNGDIIDKYFILLPEWHSDDELPKFDVEDKILELNQPVDHSIGVKNDSDKLPYFTVLFRQFPNALKEVIKCSRAGHNKYSETDADWMNFSRVSDPETRYKDAMLRHMTETGQIEDMIQYGEITHEAAVVWNALADLEIKLRKNG